MTLNCCFSLQKRLVVEFDKNYRFDLFRKRIEQCYAATVQKIYAHRTVFSWLLLGFSALMSVDSVGAAMWGAGEGLLLAEDSLLWLEKND